MSIILKPSFFNIVYYVAEEKWLFNTLNLGLVEIDENIEQILKKNQIDIEAYSNEERNTLLDLEDVGFLNKLGVDELKVLRYIYNTDKYNKDYLSITILPTLDCNCECYYCFERENKRRTKISANINLLSIEQSVLDFIESKLSCTKNLSVAWFEGEPLLKFDLIEIYSQKIINLTEKYGINYTASLTTNGFFLTEIPNVIERLKACQIGSYQITLDGAPEEHNRIRKLKSGYGTTFDKMLDGIILLYKNNLNVSVRINISKKNVENLHYLFDILEEKGLTQLKIYFGQLIDYSDKDNVNLYLNQEEYARIVEKLYVTLRKRNFRYGIDDHYPTSARSCIANRVDSAIIDCYGNIYKCRSQVGEFEKKIGNVCDYKNQTVDEAIREINWLEWSPFQYTQCKKCKILPICMGGCPFSLYDNDDALPKCDAWKYNLDFFIKQKITALKEGVNNGTEKE